MGKAEVIENVGDGLYKVEIHTNQDKIGEYLARIDEQITGLEVQIAGTTGRTKAVLELKKAALEKQKTAIQSKPDKVQFVWAADLETDISGTVGTADVPDEPEGEKNIQPKGGGHDEDRDGDIHPVAGMEPGTAYFNAAVAPGVQRWRPRYRYGKITAIDYITKTCSVALSPAFSSHQGLPINPGKDPGTMADYGAADSEPSGWASFQERYPDHPITINKEDGSIVIMSDEKLKDLEDVNKEVNGAHTYEHDEAADTWRFMQGGDTGDCEDFALTKANELISRGWNSKDLHLTGCKVLHDDGTMIGHAVLQIDTDQGTLSLDNRYPDVMAADDKKLDNYAWGLRLGGGKWKTVASVDILTDVPIEYMDCGVGAFSEGDWVLISFSGKWETPRVIGFRYLPQACPAFVINYSTGPRYDEATRSGVALLSDAGAKMLDLSSNVFYGPALIADSPIAFDPDTDEPTEYKNLIWVVGGNLQYGNDWTFGEECKLKGYDTDGNLVRTIDFQAKAKRE